MSAKKDRKWMEKMLKQRERPPLQHALVTDEAPKFTASRGPAYPLKTLRQKSNRDLQLMVDKKLQGHETAAQVLHERQQLLARHQARPQQIPVQT